MASYGEGGCVKAYVHWSCLLAYCRASDNHVACGLCRQQCAELLI